MKNQQGQSSHSRVKLGSTIRRGLTSIGLLSRQKSKTLSTNVRVARASSKWRPRRSVVVSSLAMLVGGTLITATAIPVSAVVPTATLTPYAVSVANATANAPVTANTSSARTKTQTTVGKTKVSTGTASTPRRAGAFRKRRHEVSVTTTTLVVPPFLTTTTSTPVTVTTKAPPATTTTTVPVTTTTNAPPVTTTTNAPPVTTTTVAASHSTTGVADNSEPSGFAPPGASALSGYSQTYVSDFNGSTLPAAWGLYAGQPGGDQGALFAPNHVTVGSGMLSINIFQDPAHGNEWVTGGTCLCNVASQTYGAYFVRSRMTGPGPTGVELLWPSQNVWPPEIDFSETSGAVNSAGGFVHYSTPTNSNTQIARTANVDMTQWHTWGVIWTPTSITYTVDGQVFGTVTTAAAIPNIPMFLSLQSQTWCSSGWACPSAPQSMQVDWATVYAAN